MIGRDVQRILEETATVAFILCMGLHYGSFPNRS